MKKIAGMLLIFGMVAAAAVAEIAVTGYAEGTVIPFFMEGDDSGLATGPRWAGLGPQVSVSIAGSNFSNQAGFKFSVGASLPSEYNGPLNPGEENYVWLKPFGDFLAFKAGGFNDYALRGGSYYSDLFDAAYLNGAGPWQIVNEQTVFSGFEARVNGGIATRNPAAQLVLEPMPNLYIAGSFHLNNVSLYPNTATGLNNNIDPDKNAGDYYLDGQYAVGYTIEGIGQIKAQYIGADTERGIASYSNYSRLLQAAFKLTMLPNGPIEIGATIPIDCPKTASWDTTTSSLVVSDAPDGYKEPIALALGTDLAFGNFGVKANFRGEFGGASGKDADTGMLFVAGLEPRYAITEKLTVAVPVGITFQNEGDTVHFDAATGTTSKGKDAAAYFDIGASIGLDLGATWSVHAGVVYGSQIIKGDNTAKQKPYFAVPIYFSGALF
jgi:hypothetical protein